MAVRRTYEAGVLREEMSLADGYRTFTPAGVMSSQRALTAPEQAALEAENALEIGAVNSVTLRTQAASALAGNRTFIALAAPTNAQVSAQVKALSRQMNGLIRIVLGQVDGTD